MRNAIFLAVLLGMAANSASAEGRFQATVERPVEVSGIEGLQILRVDLDDNDTEVVELRSALQRGSVLSLPARPGFQAVEFGLRGSGRAIARLEDECRAFWGYAAQNG